MEPSCIGSGRCPDRLRQPRWVGRWRSRHAGACGWRRDARARRLPTCSTSGALGAAAVEPPRRGVVAGRCRAAHLQLGNHAEARRLAAEQHELAQATDLPRLIAGALIAKAATAQRPEAHALLRAAVDLLEPLSARLELGCAHVELGSVLRRDGKRLEAQDHLRRGLELAHRAGAAPLAARARDELVAAGGRPRRPAISGVEALTASELRVARLAAEGATNREIAQRLFVTQKTSRDPHAARVPETWRTRPRRAPARSGQLASASATGSRRQVRGPGFRVRLVRVRRIRR